MDLIDTAQMYAQNASISAEKREWEEAQAEALVSIAKTLLSIEVTLRKMYEFPR